MTSTSFFTSYIVTTLLALTVVSSVHCSSCTFHYGHRTVSIMNISENDARVDVFESALRCHNLPSIEAGSLPLYSDRLGPRYILYFPLWFSLDFNYENVLERKNDAQVYVFESALHCHDLPPVGSGSLLSYSEGPGQLFILYF